MMVSTVFQSNDFPLLKWHSACIYYNILENFKQSCVISKQFFDFEIERRLNATARFGIGWIIKSDFERERWVTICCDWQKASLKHSLVQ